MNDNLPQRGDDSQGWPKEVVWGAVAGQCSENYILAQVLKIPVHRNKLHMDRKWTEHVGAIDADNTGREMSYPMPVSIYI